jgi:hypothetical protein
MNLNNYRKHSKHVLDRVLYCQASSSSFPIITLHSITLPRYHVILNIPLYTFVYYCFSSSVVILT